MLNITLDLNYGDETKVYCFYILLCVLSNASTYISHAFLILFVFSIECYNIVLLYFNSYYFTHYALRTCTYASMLLW